jgi:hypothetical protein
MIELRGSTLLLGSFVATNWHPPSTAATAHNMEGADSPDLRMKLSATL